ncbi:MAG: AEC family transporter [Burkholderiaceae bacterium]
MLSLLFPDLALIALGFVLSRKVAWGQDLWSGLERLNYFVLFPALLFHSLVRRPLQLDLARDLALAVVVVIAAGALAGLAARPILAPTPIRFASALQCAFRFNSYLALAVSQRLGGEQGLALCAICIGVAVPICNVLAVSSIARHTRANLAREFATNPLIIATVGGMALALAGVRLPEPLEALLGRCGAAALAIGLLTVGAALRPTQSEGDIGYAIWLATAKLVVSPVVALVAGQLLGLAPLPLAILVAFAAVPTSSASYVLASRMGGDGAYVAWCVTLSTLASVATMAWWLSGRLP